MKGFFTLYEAGRVKRYHTTDVPAQNLGAHSWGVAMICAQIWPRGEGYVEASPRLLMAALTHDLAESYTGDMPGDTKWANKKLNEALEDMEFDFNRLHGIGVVLTVKEEQILKWADTFELCLYCDHQYRDMSNTKAGSILAKGLAHLKELGFPTTESEELYNDIFGK